MLRDDPQAKPPSHVAFPVIGVVDAQGEKVVVWWVTLPRLDNDNSRLGGAWVLDRADVGTLASVVARRIGLATTLGRRALDDLGISFDVELDLPRTTTAVVGARDNLATAFAHLQEGRTKARRLVEPSWPSLPPELDLDDPPLADAPERVARAMGVARHLDRLVSAWDALEDIRIERPLLRGGVISSCDRPEALPYVLVGT